MAPNPMTSSPPPLQDTGLAPISGKVARESPSDRSQTTDNWGVAKGSHPVDGPAPSAFLVRQVRHVTKRVKSFADDDRFACPASPRT